MDNATIGDFDKSQRYTALNFEVILDRISHNPVFYFRDIFHE